MSTECLLPHLGLRTDSGAAVLSTIWYVMWTIFKGLIVLPFVAMVVGAVWITGSILLTIIGFVITLMCILIPLLLKVIAVAIVVLSVLWGLGKISSIIFGNEKGVV